MRGRHRWGFLAPAAALLLTLAGCSKVVDGSSSVGPKAAQSSSGQVDAPATGSAPSSSADFPSDTTMPTAAPTQENTPTSTSGTTQAGTAPQSGSAATQGDDFTNVDFVTPGGFVKPSGYSVAVPLEVHGMSAFFAPQVAPHGMDVLSVFLYALPSSGLADSPAQQLRRVEHYNTKVQAKVIGAITKTTLAGRPAFTENVMQPPNYTYVTWFTFGSRHLLQLSCQYDKSALKSTIDKGCASLRSSLKLS